MKSLNKLIPKVSKKNLLLLAGLTWGFAGFKILSIGLSEMIKSENTNIFFVFIASTIYVLFTKFVFYKMFLKHKNRILSYESKYNSFFLFFDKKAYFIMAFMMLLGIFIRNSNIFPPLYLGTFYSGLGFSLATASICFIYSYLFVNTKNNLKKSSSPQNN